MPRRPRRSGLWASLEGRLAAQSWLPANGPEFGRRRPQGRASATSPPNSNPRSNFPSRQVFAVLHYFPLFTPPFPFSPASSSVTSNAAVIKERTVRSVSKNRFLIGETSYAGRAEKTDCRFRKRLNQALIRRFWRIRRIGRTMDSSGIEEASGMRNPEYEAVSRWSVSAGPRMDGVQSHGAGVVRGAPNASVDAGGALEPRAPRLPDACRISTPESGLRRHAAGVFAATISAVLTIPSIFSISASFNSAAGV